MIYIIIEINIIITCRKTSWCNSRHNRSGLDIFDTEAVWLSKSDGAAPDRISNSWSFKEATMNVK